jgi:diaminopimelate epimerase
VEAETLACGTGATAAAEIIHGIFSIAYPIRLQAVGGELQINRLGRHLWLSGPTRKIFEGQMELHYNY